MNCRGQVLLQALHEHLPPIAEGAVIRYAHRLWKCSPGEFPCCPGAALPATLPQGRTSRHSASIRATMSQTAPGFPRLRLACAILPEAPPSSPRSSDTTRYSSFSALSSRSRMHHGGARPLEHPGFFSWWFSAAKGTGSSTAGKPLAVELGDEIRARLVPPRGRERPSGGHIVDVRGTSAGCRPYAPPSTSRGGPARRSAGPQRLQTRQIRPFPPRPETRRPSLGSLGNASQTAG